MNNDENASACIQQNYFMYVLSCADGTLYTGYTTDVEQRLRAHNAAKGAKYTRSRFAGRADRASPIRNEARGHERGIPL